MPSKILYFDIENKKLLKNARVATAVPLPLVSEWTSRETVRIVPVRPYPAGGVSTPYEVVDVTPFSCQIYVGLPGTVYASQISMTKDEANDWFEGVLVMDTSELTTAFSGKTELKGLTFEVRLISSGEPIIGLFGCSLRKPVKMPATTVPEPPDVPTWLTENLALVLNDSDTIQVIQTGDEFSFDVRLKSGGGLEAAADGLFISAQPIAPVDFLGVLRLESPFTGTVPSEGSSGTPANNSDDVSVTAAGVTGKFHKTRLRIRHNFKLRDYSGGQDHGYLYLNPTTPGTTNQQLYLDISSPAQRLYLNNNTPLLDGSDNRSYDFITPELLIAAGATVTLGYATSGTQYATSNTVPGITVPANARTPVCYISQATDEDLRQAPVVNTWAKGGDVHLVTVQDRVDIIDLSATNTTIGIGPSAPGIAGRAIFRAVGGDRNLIWDDSLFLNGFAPPLLRSGEVGLLEYWTKDTSSGYVNTPTCRWTTSGLATELYTASLSAAGSATVLRGYNCRHKTIALSISGDTYETPYTYNLALSTANARSGDTATVKFTLTANRAPTINIRNATTGGTVLLAVTGAAYAQEMAAEFYFDGTAWKLNWRLDYTNVVGATEYGQAAETYASSKTLSFDGAPYRTMTLTGDITFATSGRASAGKVKSFAILLTASGGTRTVAFHADINKAYNMVASIPSGKSAWVNFTSMGSAETNTFVAGFVNA